jgi:hypothetical protein
MAYGDATVQGKCVPIYDYLITMRYRDSTCNLTNKCAEINFPGVFKHENLCVQLDILVARFKALRHNCAGLRLLKYVTLSMCATHWHTCAFHRYRVVSIYRNAVEVELLRTLISARTLFKCHRLSLRLFVENKSTS